MNTARILDARRETERKLNKALSYSFDLQKPAQIEFYQTHIAYLNSLIAGHPCEPAKADTANWDVTRAVMEARAA